LWQNRRVWWWAGDAQPGDDLPWVTLLGLVMGVALIWAAIRAMFGKKK
jgi:hypothetical protein